MAELQARIEELERLKDQMQAVGMSITNAVCDKALILNHNQSLSIRECIFVT